METHLCRRRSNEFDERRRIRSRTRCQNGDLTNKSFPSTDLYYYYYYLIYCVFSFHLRVFKFSINIFRLFYFQAIIPWCRYNGEKLIWKQHQSYTRRISFRFVVNLYSDIVRRTSDGVYLIFHTIIEKCEALDYWFCNYGVLLRAIWYGCREKYKLGGLIWN